MAQKVLFGSRVMLEVDISPKSAQVRRTLSKGVWGLFTSDHAREGGGDQWGFNLLDQGGGGGSGRD